MKTKAKNTAIEAEEFFLSLEKKPLLEAAIDNYSAASYVTVDTIELEPVNENLLRVVVQPTGIKHLFGIFREYGRLEQEAKETNSHE